jgi:predicted Rossmann fold flavoprotein
MTIKKMEKYDVVVIGGGPAGMMAAGRAAELGAKVMLCEKNDKLGQKLLVTGNGRCNITQIKCVGREFVEKFGKKGKFLFSLLSLFGSREVINFVEQRGVETKIEKDGKVFPVSNHATDVLNVMLDYLKSGGVKIRTNCKDFKWSMSDGKIVAVEIDGAKIIAKNYILATGGMSYPTLGSTGDGYRWAKKMGHKIIKPRPSLSPLNLVDKWIKDLQGLSLPEVIISIYQDNKKQGEIKGEMIFTHFGISGPMVLNISKKVGELLEDGPVFLEIDLCANIERQEFDKVLQNEIKIHPYRTLVNYLSDLMQRRMASVLLGVFGLDGEKKLSEVRKEERKILMKLLKNLKMEVAGLVGFEKAIVTSGGVDLKEIDARTMRSKLINNLYFAGEMIDLDGPTGGYNLQMCWSTGYVAGNSAI